MKIGLISLVLVMAVAVGIGYIVKVNTVSNNADAQKTNSVAKDDSKIMDEDLILVTKEEAQEIALRNVTNGKIVEVSYDGDDYIPHYEVTVYAFTI